MFTQAEVTMEEQKKQALTEHLTDLRKCLIFSLGAVAVGFGISYSFVKDIGTWLFNPLFKTLPDQSSLIFVSYQDAFFFI
jgi:sec-independent protein translocase protein TatC